MIFLLDKSGTPQQVKWAQDAIAQCAFPIDKLFWINVTVKWDNFPGNADTRHPYMVTQVNDSDNYTIFIAPWADDPNNFNNQGLPNPPGDIYEFYKQSFVHEIGHVMTYVTFDPAGQDTDPRIAQMCALFWTPSTDPGSGRRQGAMADWDDPSLTWPQEIREAVAEVFKVAFYTGRLIYTNRTAWRLDAAQWAAFLAFLAFQTPIFHEDFATNYPDGATTPPGGSSLGGYAIYPAPNNDTDLIIKDGTLIEPLVPAGPGATPFRSENLWSTLADASLGVASIKVESMLWNQGTPPPNQSVSVMVGAGSTGEGTPQAYAQWTNTGMAPGPNLPVNQLLVVGTVNSASVPTSGFLEGFPYWVACRVTDGTVSAELWSTDPGQGGTPLWSVTVPYVISAGYNTGLLAGTCGIFGGSFNRDGSPNGFWGVPEVVCADWRWANEQINPGATYPFAPQHGSMTYGPAATGCLQVGA